MTRNVYSRIQGKVVGPVWQGHWGEMEFGTNLSRSLGRDPGAFVPIIEHVLRGQGDFREPSLSPDTLIIVKVVRSNEAGDRLYTMERAFPVARFKSLTHLVQKAH